MGQFYESEYISCNVKEVRWYKKMGKSKARARLRTTKGMHI